MPSKRVFICADHGLAVFYFLQSDIIPTLLEAGVEVVVLTEDASKDLIAEKYGRPAVAFEGLRLERVNQYTRRVSPTLQWWLDFLRRAGAASGTNLAVVDSYIQQVKSEAHARRRQLFPLMESVARLMRSSRAMRRLLRLAQRRFTPDIYADLFEKYQPDLVIAGSPGFRQDRYLLREAAKRKIPIAAAIISWDSSSSYGLPGADVDWITCWSDVQKQELVGGGDWRPERVNVAGMPPYDGYVRGDWLLSREEYFRLHNLDPQRKLLSYASSFVSWSPNIQNVEALARLVSQERLAAPSQLLVRLHPIHMSGHYVQEAERIRQLARELPHIHVVEPVPLGALGHYSGEDMAEKTSMMAHSDIFLTVYSTMCVEASFQERPIVSVCIDSQNGYPGKYWVPMSQIGVWPTHSRFRTSGAGIVALDEESLRTALNTYLLEPKRDLGAQRRFLAQECANIDGTAGKRTGQFFASLVGADRDRADRDPPLRRGGTRSAPTFSQRLKLAARALIGQAPALEKQQGRRSPIPARLIPSITAEQVTEARQFFPLDKFFIYGHARSGTTLLTRLVRLHPNVHCNYQAHFFTRQPLLQSLVADEEVASWLSRRSNRWNRGQDLSPLVLRAAADFIMERDARHAGKWGPGYVVGDKSPNSLLDGEAVQNLVQVYPDARLVFIVRDGRDAAVSHRFQTFIDRPQHMDAEGRRIRDDFARDPAPYLRGERSIFTEKALRQAAEGWVHNVQDTHQTARQLMAAQYHWLRYEDMLARPWEVMGSLWRFLGVDTAIPGLEDSLLAELQQNPDADWQQEKAGDIAGALTKGKRVTWQELFTARDRQTFKQVAGETLLEWGYEKDLEW